MSASLNSAPRNYLGSTHDTLDTTAAADVGDKSAFHHVRPRLLPLADQQRLVCMCGFCYECRVQALQAYLRTLFQYPDTPLNRTLLKLDTQFYMKFPEALMANVRDCTAKGFGDTYGGATWLRSWASEYYEVEEKLDTDQLPNLADSKLPPPPFIVPSHYPLMHHPTSELVHAMMNPHIVLEAPPFLVPSQSGAVELNSSPPMLSPNDSNTPSTLVAPFQPSNDAELVDAANASARSRGERRLASTEASPSLVQPQVKKPVHLACLFCRGRKIACSAAPADAEDQRCNQCLKRGLVCEYPTESKRGQRTKKKKVPDAASDEDDETDDDEEDMNE